MNYFISFGDKKYQNSINRINQQANDIGLFDKVIVYTDEWLKEQSEFWDLHKDFIENNPRGYGYWLWKSYITKKTLSIMSDDDILCYADAGCTVNKNGSKRMLEYFDILNNSRYGILSFEVEHPEYRWVKMDTFKTLGGNDSHINSLSLMAGCFLLRKCVHSVELIDKWYKYSCDYHLIDDSPSILQNIPEFVENRHDQSIFSLLRKIHGTEILKDEVDHCYHTQNPNFPIWASRIRN